MANFDESYKQVYLQVMYPPAEEPSKVPGLWVPPEDRAEENAMRKANMALSGMAVADTAAGMLKGATAGAVGLPGDLLGIVRGLYEIGARGGDESKLDAFMRGLNEGMILPTTSDVSKWLDENVGPVVPPGGELDQVQAFREQKAETGEMVGEFIAPGGVVGAAAKGASKVMKAAKGGAKAGAK
jgi:hypothetical protein